MMFPKNKPYRNKKILDFAKGKECQARLFNVCNDNPETVVACHFRKHEFGSGMRLKPDDCCVAFCCSACHDKLDGRTDTGTEKGYLDAEFAMAVIRTIRILFKEGIVK